VWSDALVQSERYVWSALGNLESREDLNRNLRETFTYDGLNRLKTNALYGVPGLPADT
jgi:hypothetical protein